MVRMRDEFGDRNWNRGRYSIETGIENHDNRQGER